MSGSTNQRRNSTRLVAHRLAGLVGKLDDRRDLVARVAEQVRRIQRANLFAVDGEQAVVESLNVRLAAARECVGKATTGNVGNQLDELDRLLEGPEWVYAETMPEYLHTMLADQEQLVAQLKTDCESLVGQIKELRDALDAASAEGAAVLDERPVVDRLDSLAKQARRALRRNWYDQVSVKLEELAQYRKEAEDQYRTTHQGASLLNALKDKRAEAGDLRRRCELILIREGDKNGVSRYSALLRTQGGPDPMAVNLPRSSEMNQHDWHTIKFQIDKLAEAVNSGLRKMSRTRDEPTLASADGGTMSEQLRRVGDYMYSMLVPDLIQRLLAESKGSLTITTDDMEFPWELLHDGENFLCEQRPFSRMPLSRAFPRRALPRRSATLGGDLQFLLVYADPDGNLPKAADEVNTIKERLEGSWNSADHRPIKITTLHGPEATGQALNEALLSDRYHVIHYAGHAEFDRENPERSRLLLAGNETFTAQKVQRITRGNPFVFLNACESSRAANGDEQQGTAYAGEEHKGLAAAFVYGGASACIGALWPVYDDIAAQFAIEFYDGLLNGAIVGEALRIARKSIHEKNPKHVAWAAYALYGDPTARLPILPILPIRPNASRGQDLQESTHL